MEKYYLLDNSKHPKKYIESCAIKVDFNSNTQIKDLAEHYEFDEIKEENNHILYEVYLSAVFSSKIINKEEKTAKKVQIKPRELEGICKIDSENNLIIEKGFWENEMEIKEITKKQAEQNSGMAKFLRTSNLTQGFTLVN